MNNLDNFTNLMRLNMLFQKLNQITWTADQTKKRYPYPEGMTEAEIQQLIKFYLSLGVELQKTTTEFIELYGEIKSGLPEAEV